MLVVLRPSANTAASLAALLIYGASVYPLQALFATTGIAIASVLAAAFGNVIRLAICASTLSNAQRVP